jgi:hypothetical protein
MREGGKRPQAEGHAGIVRRQPVGSPGKRTLTEDLPVPAQATSMDDVATTAVQGKGSGSALDSGVQRAVEHQLGTPLDGVRVHTDHAAQTASEAMGARAFTHQRDVFLGPSESQGDLGLMAHELTHVAQQGAAGTAAPQRKLSVGAENTPAEREADAVAARVVAGSAPGTAVASSLAPDTAARAPKPDPNMPAGADTATGGPKHTTGKQADKYLSGSAILKKYVEDRFKKGFSVDGRVHFLTLDEMKKADWVYNQGSTNPATGKPWTKAESDTEATTLEGLAWESHIYINQTTGQEDTVIHEAIHLLQSGAFVTAAGDNAKEGATEHFTHVICKEQGLTATSSYPDEHKAIKKLVAASSDDLLAGAFFLGQVTALETAVDAKGAGTFKKWCDAMKQGKYAAANKLL